MAEFIKQTSDIAIVFYDTIGSTNAEALKRAQSGEEGPLFIVAERQTAGRGRRGRRWVSEPGNLYATLLIVDPAPASATPQICFVAALALYDAVLDRCSGLVPTRLKLKWPNDLLLDGAKVSGILVEGMALSDNRMATVVGFGVNCKHHPDDMPSPANDFVQAGFDLSPRSLLESLAEHWILRAKEWNRGEGFAAIRSAWILRASGIGSSIEVRLPDRNLNGTFETIDEQGALVLRRNNGAREMITVGDVFPLTAQAG